jgi:cell division protein FtsZ
VGIVTIPFLFEGHRKIDQALDGVEEIAKYVDALLVINNERLREIYPDLNVLSAFERADNTLSVAARSIAEIITMHGIINLDFRDVCTVLKDGGVAIMSTGYGEGENRVTRAIHDALHSPLLNSNDVFNSKKVLLSISFCSENEGDSLMMEEINEVHEFMGRFREDVETKWGLSVDPDLGKKVKITILATGFGITNVPGMQEKLDNEDQDRLMQLAEKEEENDDRRRKFYGTSEKTGGNKKRPKVYLFSLDDLDNDEIISKVELTPTYKRTKEQLNEIKSKSEGQEVLEPDPTIMGILD